MRLFVILLDAVHTRGESCFAGKTMTEDLTNRTAQKQQQTW